MSGGREDHEVKWKDSKRKERIKISWGKKNQRQAYTITQTCPMKSGLNTIHGLGSYEVIGLCGGEEIKARLSGTEESEAVGKRRQSWEKTSKQT